MENSVETLLFKTDAIRVCPQDSPFWYTSGRIGPFYVNTHFLFGSEKKANDLLRQIDSLMKDRIGCSAEMERIVLENMTSDPVFSAVCHAMVEKVKSHPQLEAMDGVSGGERRDWFFSIALAALLGKPHLTLFKDKDAVLYNGRKSEGHVEGLEPGQAKEVTELKGMKFLHVADLITTASSYERAWVPAIKGLGAEMPWSLVVVDRIQGGQACLEELGVVSLSLTEIRPQLFEKAVQNGVLAPENLPMVLEYMEDPEEAMSRFIAAHPSFILEALAADEKTASRARLCCESGFYPVPTNWKDYV